MVLVQAYESEGKYVESRFFKPSRKATEQIIDLINWVAQQIRLLKNEGNDFWFEEFRSFEKSIIRKIGIPLISYKLVLIFSR